MTPLVGSIARTVWSPRGSSILALALVFAACTAEDERPGSAGSAGSTGSGSKAGTGGSSDHEARAGAGGRATDQEGQAGAGAGGVAGQDDSPSRAGAKGTVGGEAGAAGSDADPPDHGSEEPDPDPPEYVSGLPCEVEALLRARCQSCHSSHPVAGGGFSLLTYADLIAASKADPKVTMAARSLARIKDGEFPMPPSPASPASSAEIAALEAWVEASTPPGNCGSGGPNEPGPDPYVCTTESYWTAGTSGSPWMMPGRPCIACHKTTNGRGPLFAVAGTVYATAHEPDTCYGVPTTTGAVVIITDANGVELPPVPVSAGGNFGARWTTLAVPYRAKVVVGNRERVMLTPQTNGDCNACHSREGAQGALGRITLPELAAP